MEYAKSIAPMGFESSQDQFKHQASNSPVPRTLNSAAGRLDALNERLSNLVEGLAMISSQIGAMTPVSGLNSAKGIGQDRAGGGAVHRLNDAADEAHAKLGEIENYMASIGRALG